MSRKTIIIIGLAAAVVTAALVFDGVSRRRAANSVPATSQNPVTTPPAGGSANAPNAGTGVQPAAPPADTTAATEPGQRAATGADAQAPSDDNATAAAQALVVPAGTTLTVRLGQELGSKTSQAGQSFSATLDRDVVVDGHTAIASGASVTGTVVFAKPVGALAGEANLQLKLVSVSVDNADLTVVTSVRSFGPPIKGKNKVGKFFKGLAKRAEGDEREVVLDDQTAYSFILRRSLQIQ
ncbi:MAG: hypothetical protein WBP52_20175 [Terriglobales bacterium]